MQGQRRILVVDHDLNNQAEMQRRLLAGRLIVAGMTNASLESLALARDFHPDVVLLGSTAAPDVCQLVHAELPGTPVIAYSAHSLDDLLGQAEAAGVDENRPGLERAVPDAGVWFPGCLSRAEAPAAPSPLGPEPPAPAAFAGTGLRQFMFGSSTDRQAPALLKLAELISEWLRGRSLRAEQALVRTLKPDVYAPDFGGSGWGAVRSGLEMLARRFGGRARLILGELEARPVLFVLVQDGDRWRRVGHFTVGLSGGSVTYLGYWEGEATTPAARSTREVEVPACRPGAGAAA